MRRIRVPERMDDPDLPEADHRSALRGLARLNRLSDGARAVWREAGLTAAERSSPVRALDVATGSGDIALDLARRARRSGVQIEWTLCDVSEVALERARERFDAAGVACETIRADALADDLPEGFALVACGLFLHHLDPRDAARLLERLDRAASGRVVVSDLRRTRLNLLAAIVASRVVTRSPVVRFDAPASVRAAYTCAEIGKIAASVGLSDVRIRRAWPQRMTLTWETT